LKSNKNMDLIKLQQGNQMQASIATITAQVEAIDVEVERLRGIAKEFMEGYESGAVQKPTAHELDIRYYRMHPQQSQVEYCFNLGLPSKDVLIHPNLFLTTSNPQVNLAQSEQVIVPQIIFRLIHSYTMQRAFLVECLDNLEIQFAQL